MKTLTWPTTTSTTTKLYAMAHHINLLNTPINNSKPRHGQVTIERERDPARSPPDPWQIQSWTDTQPCTSQTVSARTSVSVSTRRALNLGAQVLSELWGTVRFRFRFRFRRFTSSGHWPPWAELFVVHQNQTIHTNIELSRQSSMKLYGSLAFDLCPAAEKGKNQNGMEVCELTTMQYPLLKYTEIKSKAYNSFSFNMNKVLKFVFFLTSNQSISFLDIVYFSLMCLTINVCLF